MPEKYIKDNKVAILISPGYGAGWSTWERKELAYDKRIVEKFLEGATATEMQDFIVSLGYEEPYTGGYEQLQVVYVPVGTKFIIEEYDGSEYLKTVNDFEWITA